MRVVLDTNVFLSALLSEKGPPARIVEAWRTERFDLITSVEQIDEVKRAARYDKMQPYVLRAEVGRLVKGLRHAHVLLSRLPRAGASPDPADDFILAMCLAAEADYLVTGDRALSSLGHFATTRIVTPRSFAMLLAS